MTISKALTIAGSDSGGGAGIQADLKTFQELGAYGMSAITAVTAQNTLGVHGVYPVSIEGIVQQIDAIGEDLGTDALKTGMLFSGEVIEAVSERIHHYGWENIVVDPVMIAKGGAKLLQDEAIRALKEKLLPLTSVITPNIPEAEVLTEMKISSLDDRRKAAKQLMGMGAKAVVIKGGHADDKEVIDLFFDGTTCEELMSPRIETLHTHGTGCTFSAAITAQLANGMSMRDAVLTAKEFIRAAIEDGLGIGGGHGPTNHWAYNKRGEK
ncbi:hydroxymethylpyrimidine/phosphomethylpyrimidine kinase [[Bacillus] enclensis]|uniref:Hydroxymethylpyrimidine/phosphomethylpyrimidine kinase n=1 Tax=[Bacillus] enclensis TaxID=1402860 RepID=A0A0V8HKJ2_9BACI|nr:bifunctional hydroxymethylpyrimidine kinase/phosphomethylpyrimidine kinase [[Bacillus] enclensis]KSU62887.1 hydroxymethylpyrimidine/phosphomethylpyrimidine kinase [[Bacillus] enclensis]MBH9965043.1 bifunctional hydroxymethylpyrimidine kinase/phosphomethylpyrimidine kinase [[Bacillus] enclensis]SCC11067.1 hydroxymethylpyrimidine/phosphomethylpyrimidine kinase [[Bacillus] enclensis]